MITYSDLLKYRHVWKKEILGRESDRIFELTFSVAVTSLFNEMNSRAKD